MIDIPTCFTYAYSAGTIDDFYQTIVADGASTNYIDLDVAGINITNTWGPYLVIRVGTAYTTTVSINISVQTDSDSGFATTLRTVKQIRVALAQLTAGALIVNEKLADLTYQRYLRLYFDFFTGAGAGSLLAYLASGPEPHVTDFDQVDPAS
jgi:hypothetical protein